MDIGKIDKLAVTAAIEVGAEKDAACDEIFTLADRAGIEFSSIHNLYMAIGKGGVKGFTVPAINIRGLTYNVAQAVFRAAMKEKAGAVIFEIARSEIDYTFQRPKEYAALVTAAALKENFKGRLFLQGDHFQAKAKSYFNDPAAETAALQTLIKEAIDARFYNIDIDSSTLVDLEQSTIYEQQRNNFELCAKLTRFIRDIEPAGITISVGGEIGEVGGKNSTVEELCAFMDGFREATGDGIVGISKISVQTGTTHGGVPLPDGTIAKVKLDFDTLERISKVAREKYGLGGAVQHGASTLPLDLFDRFPQTGTVEIHLATEFQNMIYEHPKLPEGLRSEIYEYLERNFQSERKEGETEQQFIYKTRKKGFGPFKKEFLSLDDSVKEAIMNDLEEKFTLMFRKLGISGTSEMIEKYF